MSSPTSTKLAPPTYVDPRVRRRNIIGYILQIWVSLIPGSFLLYWFYYDYVLEISPFATGIMQFSFRNLIEQVWIMPLGILFILTPIILLLVYLVTVIWAAVVTKLVLLGLNIIRKPIEGVFTRNLQDRDYVYWNKRNLARVFLFWLLHSVPFTFLKITFSYRFLDVKVGKKAILNHCWIAPEFVKIGNNVTLGQSAGIYSFQFQGDKLLVAQVILEDNVIVGPQTVLLPGTIVNKGAIIDGGSFSHPFTVFEKDGIYHGNPAKLVRKSQD
ncbi:hypothetical protein NEF87_004944 [Candidatus Lokiarchaeum ossiferum]|uniref:Acetyltransferase n=1 Tax=Candidatus Lokiarchaeum ossiferum TaxID=2951803 RepID=A0ABY6I1U1_9ARCH|nr:hypothetical protein NEF87_004944 [Candidatus Lokiarchaeum sp. B-35]